MSWLRTFLAVSRTGSLTAASHVLGLSQPTVTEHMRQLEHCLEATLLHRHARGVTVTARGTALIHEIAHPLDTLEQITHRANSVGNSQPVPVHVAGPAELLATRVMPTLAGLAEHGIALHVSTGLTDELLTGLQAGDYDLVIATTRPRGRHCRATPLMDEDFVLVAAPNWADHLRHPDTHDLDVQALNQAPLVAYNHEVPILRRYWRHVFGHRLENTPTVTIPDLRGVRAATEAGAGITVLPRYLCHHELTTGTLIALLEPDDPPINTCYLAQRPGNSDNPGVTTVRNSLLETAHSW